MAHTLSRVEIAGLYAITPDIDDTPALVDRVDGALQGGTTLIQYRNKTASAAKRLQQAEALRERCLAHGARLIVNDDVELALAVGADGVHLGGDDATIPAARARLGPFAVIGASCYADIGRAEAAVSCGADYIAFGSFFASSSKPDAVRAPLSLLLLAKARWQLPVVAIGGITVGNARPLLVAGADALAVIGGVFGTIALADVARVTAAARSFNGLFETSRPSLTGSE